MINSKSINEHFRLCNSPITQLRLAAGLMMEWIGAMCHVHVIDELVDLLVDLKEPTSFTCTLVTQQELFHLTVLIFTGSREYKAIDPHSRNAYPGDSSF